MRIQVGSIVVEEVTPDGNLRIGAAHLGGIVHDRGPGRGHEVIIEKAVLAAGLGERGDE